MNIIKEYPLCVGEIQTILNMKQSNVSRHLEKLKSSGLIICEKKAQWIYYQLSMEKFEKYPFIKQLLFEDLKNDIIYQDDIYKLNQYKSSALCCQDLRNVGFDFSKIEF